MKIRNRILRYIVCLAAFLCLHQLAWAQSKLSKRVNVYANNQRLADVLELLSKKGDFYFSYSSKLIAKDSLVNINASDKSIREVLDILLKGNFEYKETQNYIILRYAILRFSIVPQKIDAGSQSYTFSGYVEDANSGQKVSNASVYEKRLLLSALTDSKGYFKLKVNNREQTIVLTVSKEQYRDTTVVILAGITVRPGNKNDNDENEVFDEDGNGGSVERRGIGRFLVSSRQKIQSINLSNFFAKAPFQVSFTPGLSSHGMLSAQVINKGSWNILGGYTAGVKGFEMAGLFNINKKSVSFFQAAGLFNLVGGSMRGFQLAGLSNTVLDSAYGWQSSGLYNDVKRNVSGFQMAGLMNKVGGSFKGVQVTGLLNKTKLNQSGFQMAGLFNIVGASTKGAQVAGLLNISNDNVSGLQFAGIGNIGKNEVSGLQLAAVFNYAAKLKGVQIGFINIADESDGYSIGLFNVVRNGYHKVSFYTNEVTNANISFKSGNKKLYSILMAGSSVTDSNKVRTFGMGVGHDFIFNKTLSLSTEFTSQSIFLGNWTKMSSLMRLKAGLNVHLGKYVSVYAAPVLNLYQVPEVPSAAGYKQTLPSSGYPLINNDKDFKSWIGWEFGITLF